MTRRRHLDSIGIDHQPTFPTVFTGGDDQRLVVADDDPTLAAIVVNNRPYLLTNTANTVITNVLGDGKLLRTIDGGTTPIFVKVTATKARIRFRTYQVTTSGLVVAQGIVRCGVRGSDPATTTGPRSIAYAKGSGSFMAQTPADGTGDGVLEAVTGTAGDLGLFDATVTFGATTGVKTITLCYGGDQFVLSVDIT